MSLGIWLDALCLPPECVHSKPRRVPKLLLAGQGGLGAVDRRLVKEDLAELWHLATLKPEACGIPAYEDAERSYQDLAVLSLEVRERGRCERLATIVHRALPHHVVLLCLEGADAWISLAPKRASQVKEDAWVIEGEPLTVKVDGAGELAEQLRGALALTAQPTSSLRTVYEGWLEALVAWRVAQVTGTFERVSPSEAMRARVEALETIARLAKTIKRLRTEAKREKQVRTLVELNAELRRLEQQYKRLHGSLTSRTN